jgi:hypothetical protein
MSMTWMGCLNHNLAHAASKKSERISVTVTVRDLADISVRLHPYDP